VRSEDGTIRRRAAAVKSGEALSLTFADGSVEAVAAGTRGRTKSPSKTKEGSQGDLF